MSMSLAQGGSGFSYFAHCVFQYLCGVPLHKIFVAVEDIADFEVQNFLNKVTKLPLSRACRVSALFRHSIFVYNKL